MAINSQNVATEVFPVEAKASIETALRQFGDYLMRTLNVNMPVIVEEVNRDRGTVTVKPLANIPYISGGSYKSEERSSFEVTPIQMRSHGFIIRMPPKKGDTGWVISSDRDTYEIKKKNSSVDPSQNEGAQDIKNFNIHEFTKGFFVQDSWANFKFDDNENFSGRLVIGDAEADGDGKMAYVTFGNDGVLTLAATDKVSIKSDDKVDIVGKTINATATDVNVSAENINAIGAVSVEGDTAIHGELEVEKKATFDDDIEVEGDAAIGGDLDVEGDTTVDDINMNGTIKVGDVTVELLETEYVEKYDSAAKQFKTRIAHVLRTNGEVGTPIPASQVVTDGGGGGGGVTPIPVDVVVGLDFEFDAQTNRLKCVMTKKTIGAVSVGSTSTSSADLPLWKQNVIVKSQYSTDTHKFTNYKMGGVKTSNTSEDNATEVEVFTATEHEAEMD